MLLITLQITYSDVIFHSKGFDFAQESINLKSSWTIDTRKNSMLKFLRLYSLLFWKSTFETCTVYAAPRSWYQLFNVFFEVAPILIILWQQWMNFLYLILIEHSMELNFHDWLRFNNGLSNGQSMFSGTIFFPRNVNLTPAEWEWRYVQRHWHFLRYNLHTK